MEMKMASAKAGLDDKDEDEECETC